MSDPTLDERLQETVAQARQSPPGSPTRDPVNRPMIHHWCDAIGDFNPIYVDEELAAQSIHGGIVAPPTMLQAWGMAGLRGRGPSIPDTLRAKPPSAATGPNPMRILQEAGYSSVVATDCEQDYLRYLKPGDVLRMSSLLESVSSEKATGLGTGYFVTQLTTYYDQNDEVVAEMRFRTLWFKPRQRG
jgi:acyl dehydratase